MRKWVSTLAAGVAGAALLASGALAQDDREQSPPQTVSDDASFDEAFPQMVSEPLVQGDLEAPGPIEAYWTLEQVESLLAFIDGIEAEGLVKEDYRPDKIREVLAVKGPGGDLNRAATEAFVWLVEDLRDGRTPMSAREQWFVVDPDRDRFRTRDMVALAMETGDISGVLQSLNPTHSDYARLREELARTPESETAKRKLIIANMDRWRWLQRDLGQVYLLTNVPEYQLRLTVGEQIIKTYRTIVGKPGRTATPQLAEMVEGVVFNPTWTVPQSIVRGEGLGERVLGNPSWARANGYTATRGSNGWITVVQQPGPGNSLGRMKLEMPNEHAIFFHDTPSRGLFSRDARALSHGCIRTERALELAITMAILGRGATRDEAVEIATSGKYTKVMIERQIPAYITYFTMGVDIEGNLQSFEDIYGRDAPVLASFDKPREANRSGVSDDEIIVIENDPRDAV